VPEVCNGIEREDKKRHCIQIECAKECQTLGGDEVLWYRKGSFDDLKNMNVICCQSTTREQEERVQKKLGSPCAGFGGACALVSELLAAASADPPAATTP
jgi:hypothetical protein